MPEDPPTPDRFRHPAAGALALLGLTVLALGLYGPALDGAILWDDPAHLTREGLRGWDGLRRIWFDLGATQEYYPVLHSAFWLEHRLWGDATTPYHVLNVLLHVANCGLLACLLRRIWGASPADAALAPRPVPLPAGTEWLAAVLLAVHPVAVESVAWITEQKNTLSTALYLLAALCHLDFADRRRWRSYVLALTLFLAAMGAKTMTVTLPAALLVVLWWRRGSLQWKRDGLPLLPWFAAALGAGLFTVWFEGNWVGAEAVADELTWTKRALLAARIFWFSLGQLCWPVNLTFFYPRWEVAAEATGWIPHLVAGVAVTGLLWWYRTRSRGPLAAWLLYAGTLFPVLGFFNIFSFSFSYVADHYQYLAMPVFCAVVAVGAARIVARIPAPFRAGAWLLGAVILSGFGCLAHRQSRLYEDDPTLFRANVAANPGSWMGQHILATVAAKSPGQRKEAIALFRRALQLKPRNPDSLAALAALLAEQPGHRDEVIANFQEALRLRPTFAEAHNGLANELADLPGRLPEAIEHYRTALRLRPHFGLARANLAQALARLPGHEAEALERFAEVLRVMPDHLPAHYHLANLLATLPNREAEALPHYEYVLSRRPDSAEAHARFGDLLIRLGRKPEGLAQYETALEIEPRMAWVQFAFATQLADIPTLTFEALQHARDAVKLQPDYVEAHNLIGVIQARLGRTDEARASWNRALQLKPDFEPARRNLQQLEQNNPR